MLDDTRIGILFPITMYIVPHNNDIWYTHVAVILGRFMKKMSQNLSLNMKENINNLLAFVILFESLVK